MQCLEMRSNFISVIDSPFLKHYYGFIFNKTESIAKGARVFPHEGISENGRKIRATYDKTVRTMCANASTQYLFMLDTGSNALDAGCFARGVMNSSCQNEYENPTTILPISTRAAPIGCLEAFSSYINCPNYY
jgi:hypothetical protein